MPMTLEAETRKFAAQLANLLNQTVTNGIRIGFLATSDGLVNIGCDVKKSSPSPDPIPLAISGAPRVWLYFQQSYSWDDEEEYLTTTRSTMNLYSSPAMGDEALILGVDYVRDSVNEYPNCHIHVHGDRNDLDEICRSDNRKKIKLRDLHFPVGGKRFRITLEDVIEFAIIEGMAAGRDGWSMVIDQHRRHWENIQTSALIRRNQDLTANCLKELGWTVTKNS